MWIAMLELAIVLADKAFDAGVLGHNGQIAVTLSALAKAFLRFLTKGPVET